ncbi:LexA family protein [Streptomyces collinus]|uniref:LexA family protein n=1 Tax=Streptomyces collinus TaxID=42684 RepID=UPI00362DB349
MGIPNFSVTGHQARGAWEGRAVAEIGRAVGMRSRASVHYQLVELETKRAIVREPGRSRGIRLRRHHASPLRHPHRRGDGHRADDLA